MREELQKDMNFKRNLQKSWRSVTVLTALRKEKTRMLNASLFARPVIPDRNILCR